VVDHETRCTSRQDGRLSLWRSLLGFAAKFSFLSPIVHDPSRRWCLLHLSVLDMRLFSVQHVPDGKIRLYGRVLTIKRSYGGSGIDLGLQLARRLAGAGLQKCRKTGGQGGVARASGEDKYFRSYLLLAKRAGGCCFSNFWRLDVEVHSRWHRRRRGLPALIRQLVDDYKRRDSINLMTVLFGHLWSSAYSLYS